MVSGSASVGASPSREDGSEVPVVCEDAAAGPAAGPGPAGEPGGASAGARGRRPRADPVASDSEKVQAWCRRKMRTSPREFNTTRSSSTNTVRDQPPGPRDRRQGRGMPNTRRTILSK